MLPKMMTYQEWRETIGALMAKLMDVNGFTLHASYKRYAQEWNAQDG